MVEKVGFPETRFLRVCDAHVSGEAFDEVILATARRQ